MQRSNQQLLLVGLNKPIPTNLQFMSIDDLNDFVKVIKKYGINEYSVKNLKLITDQLLVLSSQLIVISDTKICYSYVRSKFAEASLCAAKLSH